MPSGPSNSPEEAQPWRSRSFGWRPSLWEGLRACCYFLLWIISSCTVSFVEMEDLYRKAGDLATQKSTTENSLIFCLVPEQRATVYGGLSISHPLCRLCPYLSCCSLTSALGSVGSIFQIKKQKKRSYSLRVLVDFSFLPPPQGAAVGLDPPWRPTCPSVRAASSQKMAPVIMVTFAFQREGQRSDGCYSMRTTPYSLV